MKLEALSRDMNSSRKFIYDQFTEQLDNTVREAKAAVEAFTQNRLMLLGDDEQIVSLPVSAENGVLNCKNEN